jgi:hypothetical protein
VEDRAAQAEREAPERVLRVEPENAAALVSAHEAVEGLAQKSPSSMVSLRKCARPGRWPRRKSAACPMWRLTVHDGWWSLRGGARSSLRSSPFFNLGALSCVSPLLVHHG